MSYLSNVKRGMLDVPDRMLVYGPGGVGKSSFAAQFPGAIVADCDQDGTAQLDVPRLPLPEDWGWRDFLDALDALEVEEHDYKYLVIDTADHLEPKLWKHVCSVGADGESWDNIESPGFGKGYAEAVSTWRDLLSRLERLRRKRGMGIIFLAHTAIKTFKNPSGEDYDRHEMKLHKSAGALLLEWCDVCMFARFEESTEKDKRTKRFRGISNGARILCTEREAAFDAKNRYSLPAEIPLSYEAYAEARKVRAVAPSADLVAEIQKKIDALTDDKIKARALAGLKRAGDDAVKLAALNNFVNAGGK